MVPLQYYLFFVILGFVVTYLFRPRVRKFSWQEYTILLSGPFVGLVLIIYMLGPLPFYIFVLVSFGFTLAECIVVFTYHKIMGSHLWIYERLNLPGKYTSFLSIPLWGFWATFLWLIFRVI